MGDDGAQKNQRRHTGGNVLFGLNGSQHKIGARILPQAGAMIGKHDEQTGKGQQKKQPVIGLPGSGCLLYTSMQYGVNIATMKVFRQEKNTVAYMVLETDQEVAPETLSLIHI